MNAARCGGFAQHNKTICDLPNRCGAACLVVLREYVAEDSNEVTTECCAQVDIAPSNLLLCGARIRTRVVESNRGRQTGDTKPRIAQFPPSDVPLAWLEVCNVEEIRFS